jgi:hypothetical protein
MSHGERSADVMAKSINATAASRPVSAFPVWGGAVKGVDG